MPLYDTESLILKSYNLAEADRIVVFFSKEHGIIRGVAKGAKRLKSKFGSTLEPFSTVHISYFQKDDRELVSIQNVEMINSSFLSASEPEFLATFSYIADLLTSFAPPHDPNETLYRMTQACLDAASTMREALPSIRLYFEIWLLRLGGYLPDWHKCNNCKSALTNSETVGLQAGFELMCSNCRKTRGINDISSLHREVFFSVQKLSPVDFIKFASNRTTTISDVSAVMKRIISQVIGREVSDLNTFVSTY